MIYGRFGDKVEIIRRGKLADVQKLDGRRPDQRDREAIENLSYVVVRDDNGSERLYHLAFLRADDGSREISARLEQIDAGKE